MLATAALLALATGCGSGDGSTGTSSTTSRTTSLSVKDTSISAEPGERFTLTVDQNASTREYWYLVDPRPDSSVLVSRGRAADSGDGTTAPGSGHRLTFTFEAKAKGTTRFTLLHCTFTTCQGNTSTKPPATTGASAEPSATTGASAAPAPERITYTVTVR
ncbi:protease inhibitor I42 family protein [Streptomyces sp. LaPpAH-108]|uniref:protease inhibitor I42 family protein n=1 Tax=Streptomyces sp. LaPpAH-108 TaxID=1155714 RepID=UPI00037F1D8B|nr:protease inhibitor I42 family protein [Streptomyces sp. LaPpAH-108]